MCKNFGREFTGNNIKIGINASKATVTATVPQTKQKMKNWNEQRATRERKKKEWKNDFDLYIAESGATAAATATKRSIGKIKRKNTVEKRRYI